MVCWCAVVTESLLRLKLSHLSKTLSPSLPAVSCTQHSASLHLKTLGHFRCRFSDLSCYLVGRLLAYLELLSLQLIVAHTLLTLRLHDGLIGATIWVSKPARNLHYLPPPNHLRISCQETTLQRTTLRQISHDAQTKPHTQYQRTVVLLPSQPREGTRATS